MPTSTNFQKGLEIRNKRLSGPIREMSPGLSHTHWELPTNTIKPQYIRCLQCVLCIILGARAASPDEEDTKNTESAEGETTHNLERGPNGKQRKEMAHNVKRGLKADKM